MERMTKKVDGVWTALCKYGGSPHPVVTQETIDRLAAYEETGLEPEEVTSMCDMDRRAKMAEMLRLEESFGVSIDRLRELAEADKEGRCVVQPRSDDTQTAMPAGAAPIVYCKDCAYLRYSDFYGECSRGLLGIVGPLDYCRRGRVKEGAG